MGRTPEPWVLGMASRPCQRRARRLATHRASPGCEPRVGLPRALKLREQCRILVARKQPEQDAVGETEGTLIGGPSQLDQPAVLIDGPRFGDPEPFHGPGRKQVAPPKPGFLLPPSNGERGFVIDHGGAERIELRRIPSRIGDDLRVCPVLDWRACGFL